ncbi:NBR1-Ig-like domain-containing protein [Streptomyces sp. SID13031]|uniref:NBR1-Ig-like domain-containing protein n=1 Tax=Streptomyces sp. SID13031 TaxID=2706046 RepID=UPI0013C5B519|nr:NBR1-Ig-like domain-containing protein [Streptomyces sp. SID13031]NEA32805.1 hypothetical protein [Streptomyces sp. SID13031]
MRTSLTKARGVLGSAGRRGRPPQPAPVHLFASRELTVAMRQLRGATGSDLERTVEILNQTIEELYPGASPEARPGGDGGRSTPRLVSAKYVSHLERGLHSRREQVPQWAELVTVDRVRTNASRVPAWLVRAYDIAFGADGFLADVYVWSEALREDQSQDLPRRTRDLPADVVPGEEYACLIRDLGAPAADLRTLLSTQAAELAAARDRYQAAPRLWVPAAADKSGFLGEAEEEAPEGTVVAPGSMLVARFVVHNVGQVPWRDRLMYRVGSSSAGICSPPFVPLADTDPGSFANVRWVLRAPTEPGTYRMCVKMGWPDGTYCFPTTLLGVIITLIVPPADIADPYQDWPDHDR